jgi:hypothetical protein
MRLRQVTLLLFAIVFFASCQKNTVSKIPHIALMAFQPDSSMRVNLDTCYIEFSLVDGDGDIGSSMNGSDTVSVIYLQDSRSVGSFTKTAFPAIDRSIEDPKKGLQGTCVFYPLPQPVPRPDSIHHAFGDTLSYELYITDRAGHASNHITTHPLIITP